MTTSAMIPAVIAEFVAQQVDDSVGFDPTHRRLTTGSLRSPHTPLPIERHAVKKSVPPGSVDPAEALAYLATTVSEYEPMRGRSAAAQAFFALIRMTVLASVLILIVLALAVGGCIALGALGFISLMRFA